MDQLRHIAARNNAELCAAVHRAHGHASAFTNELWSTTAEPLPYYPNAVTLSDSPGARRLVEEFVSTFDSDDSWGIKDSWASLDLGPGFQSFDGAWLAGSGAPAAPGPEAEPIRGADGLVEWETAWRSGPYSFRQFPAALLDEPGFTFWAFREQGAVVSGCLTNEAGEAVGFSNVFGPTGLEASWWGRNLDFLSRAFAGRPLVGWEREPDSVDPERRLQRLGPLRVWLSPAIRG